MNESSQQLARLSLLKVLYRRNAPFSDRTTGSHRNDDYRHFGLEQSLRLVRLL